MTTHKIEFLVNQIAFDWLTCGSFDARDKQRYIRALDNILLSKGDSKLMQYYGESWGEGFVGQAEQNGRIHTLCKVSGAAAERAFWMLKEYATHETSWTRLDIQLTIPLPDWYVARELADYLRLIQRRKVELYESSGGLDTVYIGSRKSAKYWRIYVKQDAGGGKYLRFEIEIKKDRDRLPDRLVSAIKGGGRPEVSGYFFSELDALKLPSKIMSLCDNFRSGTTPLPHYVRDQGERTYRWLVEQVEPAIVNFAIKHHGREQLIIDWLEHVSQEIVKRKKP